MFWFLCVRVRHPLRTMPRLPALPVRGNRSHWRAACVRVLRCQSMVFGSAPELLTESHFDAEECGLISSGGMRAQFVVSGLFNPH